MGFPNRLLTETPTLAFDGSNPPRPTRTAHVCPRCKARVADLPTACNVCSLPLVRVLMIEGYTRLLSVCLCPPSPYLANPTIFSSYIQTQVSSSHLARSYHHLFPVIQFNELATSEQPEIDHCHSCQRHLDVTSKKVVRLRCPQCQNVFCLDCDMYIHESLHNCPGCSAA